MESKVSPPAAAAPALRRRDLALLLPGLLLLAWAGFTWGGYFWLTGRVQAAADRAAQAVALAPSGLDPLRLARAAAEPLVSAPLADLSVDQDGGVVRVRISFDLSNNPVYAIRGPTPLPSPIITRAAEAPIAAAVAADRSAALRPDPDAGRPDERTRAGRSE